MNFKRNKNYAVNWRQTPKDTRMRSFDFQTMELKVVTRTKICSCCGQELPISCFYIESRSNRKHLNQTRTICVDCWDSTNGKIYSDGVPPRKKKVISDITIDEFIFSNEMPETILDLNDISAKN